MKKVFLTIFIAMVAFSAFAIEGLSFEAVNQTPLFREPVADPYAFNTHVYVVYDAKSNSQCMLRTLVSNGPDKNNSTYSFIDLPYTDEKDNFLVNMKISGNVNAFHFTYDKENFPKLEFELNVAGSMNTLFVLAGSCETLDFDGEYFVGSSVKIADLIAVRFGIHHFSTHWGDETLEKLYDYIGLTPKENTDFTYEGKKYYYHGLIEYVRDNSWLVGVSADLPLGFRVYSEIEIPRSPSWLRPFIHTPSYYQNSGDGKNDNSGSVGTGNTEGIHNDTQILAESALKAKTGYAALRVHGGVEWRHDFGFGTLVLATDVQGHQDGKTKHQIGEYAKSNPWDWEVTAGASYEFAHVLNGEKAFSIDAYYHYGRTPAQALFYRTGSFIYLGVGIH